MIELTQEESATNAETWKHIDTVMRLLASAQIELMRRQFTHDRSKLVPPEVSTFVEFTPKLKESTYGSEEYKGFLKEMAPALENHYSHNRHHPEYASYIEEWRSIGGYEGLYEVSNFGQVRSLDRVIKRDSLQGDLQKRGQIKKAHVTPKGYLRMQLAKDGEQKNFLVHRLVANAFLPSAVLESNEINHKDGNKRNNRAKNLEWVTSQYNLQHSYDLGLRDGIQLKYIVHCVELDITTYGVTKMETALKKLGYEKARASTILACLEGNSRHCVGLTFTSENIDECNNFSYVEEMNLFDLIEMFIDWNAAVLRHDDGDINKSIEINTNRFNLSPQIVQIFKNTIPWVKDEFAGLETQKDLGND